MAFGLAATVDFQRNFALHVKLLSVSINMSKYVAKRRYDSIAYRARDTYLTSILSPQVGKEGFRNCCYIFRFHARKSYQASRRSK